MTARPRPRRRYWQDWEALHLALVRTWRDDLEREPAASDPILTARIIRAIETLVDDSGRPVRGRHITGAQP